MGKTPEELYNERAKRLEDATQLRIPDRIPIILVDVGLFVRYSGFTWAECIYDPEKAKAGTKKMVVDLSPDAYFGPAIFTSGQVHDRVNFKQLKWPGAKLEANRLRSDGTYQFIEPGTGYEAMPAEEYDWFLDDPADWVIRRHWPRIAKGLEPLKNLAPFHNVVSYQGWGYLSRFGLPEVATALESLIEAGREALKFKESLASFLPEMVKLGFPPLAVSNASAPFDYIGDFLRGTQGIMLDMYRQPDKLKKVLDKVAPWIIEKALAEVEPLKEITRFVPMFLHKGAGGFMSNDQFKEFYWPSLRTVMMGIIEGGFTPYVYTEGIFTDRLPIIKDVPKGKVIYHIEDDIFKAKEILGDIACIEGGPPGSMLNVGSPEDVKVFCKKLIDVCGEGGGFRMGTALPLLTAKIENVKAMVEFTKEYGVYK